MREVWKYVLSAQDEQVIRTPAGAKILCVDTQRDYPCVWALVNTETSEREDHVLRIVGTGHSIEDDIDHWPYIGTFQLSGGSLVFHLFEKLEDITS